MLSRFHKIIIQPPFLQSCSSGNPILWDRSGQHLSLAARSVGRAGLVLFVTGRCERALLPTSEDRRGKDVAYADEQPVGELADILSEGRAIGALLGITGGEPS